MKINKNKVFFYCLLACCWYDWQKSSGAEKKVTPRRLSESGVMDIFPQGIIDSFSHNDVNLTKRGEGRGEESYFDPYANLILVKITKYSQANVLIFKFRFTF